MSSTLRPAPAARPAPEARRSLPIGPERPTAERIRACAFQIYLDRLRTGAPGDAASDWAKAERQLRADVFSPGLEAHMRIRGETLLRLPD